MNPHVGGAEHHMCSYRHLPAMNTNFSSDHLGEKTPLSLGLIHLALLPNEAEIHSIKFISTWVYFIKLYSKPFHLLCQSLKK